MSELAPNMGTNVHLEAALRIISTPQYWVCSFKLGEMKMKETKINT